MTISRRDMLTIAAGASLLPAVGHPAQAAPVGGSAAGRSAIRNPVFAGDHPDPTVLKDGDATTPASPRSITIPPWCSGTRATSSTGGRSGRR